MEEFIIKPSKKNSDISHNIRFPEETHVLLERIASNHNVSFNSFFVPLCEFGIQHIKDLEE